MAKHTDQPWQQAQREKIKSGLPKGWPRHAADENQIATPFRTKQSEISAELSEKSPMMGEGRYHLRIRRAPDGKQYHAPALPLRRIRDCEGKATAAANDGQRAGT